MLFFFAEYIKRTNKVRMGRGDSIELPQHRFLCRNDLNYHQIHTSSVLLIYGHLHTLGLDGRRQGETSHGWVLGQCIRGRKVLNTALLYQSGDILDLPSFPSFRN